jgi:hypothetical protein
MASGNNARKESDPATLMAFLGVVTVAGGNAVAIRYTSCESCELDPFWGAATRFLLASFIFAIIVRALHIDMPRGRALLGAALYGALQFGGGFGFSGLGESSSSRESTPQRSANVAVTLLAASIFTAQDPVPVQAPLQRTNLESDRGVAVSFTTVPLAYGSEQSVPQRIPAGELWTNPLPVPAFVTVSVKVGVGGPPTPQSGS